MHIQKIGRANKVPLAFGVWLLPTAVAPNSNAWDQDLGRVRVSNVARYIEGLQAK